ncbi:MAG: CapA family protein [Oscillospiraceae bacterium]|nr:CapA family protein [Oscillospiraceae bacterium]
MRYRYLKIVLCGIIALFMLISSGCSAMALKKLEQQQPAADSTDNTGAGDAADNITDTEPDTESDTAPDVEPEPIPMVKTSTVYTLSFAGDCTFGGMVEHLYNKNSFISIVGENYAYPFEYCTRYFAYDDFTIVNLEGVLSDYRGASDKLFKFVAPPEYAAVLTEGSVEAVNFANNHTYDFGKTGYNDTKTALENEGISYVEDKGTLMYTTESGLKLGIYSAQFNMDHKNMQKAVQEMRADGAEIIIVSYHGGKEGSYRVTGDQERHCRAAIDAGADIVYGHHSHRLQPVEEYNGGIIFYSLGNFSFAGNGNPQDKDTAIIQQKFIRDSEGNLTRGETILIPYSISSTKGTNDYRPMPLEEGTEEYDICLSKLLGTFDGPDYIPYYENDDTEGQDKEEEGETTDTPADTPTDTPTDPPADTPTDTPSDTPGDTPADTPTDTPSDTPSDTPTQETPPADTGSSGGETPPADASAEEG